MTIVRPPRVSRPFVAALLLAAGIIIQNPRSPEAWSTAAGIIAAAVSGGATTTKP